MAASSTTFRQYARGDVYTNTVEGSFSVFQRGMRGIYEPDRSVRVYADPGTTI